MKLRRPLTVSGAHPHSVCSRYVRKARDCTSVYCVQLAIKQFGRLVWKPKQFSDTDYLLLWAEKTDFSILDEPDDSFLATVI